MSLNLSEMPDVIMKAVMENLEFESIQNVRKVCHKFRNFIDSKKIDFKLLGITVNYYPSKIKLMLRSDRRYHEFFYHKKDDGCLVVKEKRLDPPDKTRFEKDKDFVSVFLEEFENLLNHQKSILEDLQIFLNHNEVRGIELSGSFLEGLSSILKSRARQLRVQKLYMLIISQEEVLQILPLLDSDFLTRIDLNHALEWPKKVLNIVKLVHLSQWRNAWELGIWRCMVSEPIESFAHFSKVDFVMKECSFDMQFLKETLLQSDYFDQWKIYFRSFQDEEKIVKIFGRPHLDKDKNKFPRKRCFLKIPDSDQCLVVTISDRRSYGDIRINRLPLVFVPKKVFRKSLLY